MIWKVGIAGFILGSVVACCMLAAYSYANPQPTFRALRESDIPSSSGYTFTDPIIGLTSGTNNNAPEYAQLQKKITDYIAAQKQSGLMMASVKFGDVEAAEGFTINPDATYAPASLTKVPLVMAYYQLAEEDASILSQGIFYSGEPDLDASEQIKSAVQLVPGRTYTVAEMIEHMIRYSDNNAEQLLANHLSSIGKLDTLTTLFADLGIKINPDNPDYMTVQSYSLFLRVLFNATFLDRNYSEKLLQLLSQSDFTAGIRAGVPSSIAVAAKFGDARIPDSQGNIIGAELQNCGIVYYPDHPYNLCIMTKGSSITDLERIISAVSQLIYNEVQSRYPVPAQK